jgi:hypothetical protein
MEYCSSCRRHLNGALVCPGCGAYAPDIAPSASGGRIVPARTGPAATDTPAWEFTGPDPWQDTREEAGVGAAADQDPSADPSGGLEGAPVPQGRAARRRQMVRWKKNKRRAAVATAVALVGGGLTLASMDGHSTDRTQASTAPVVPNTGADEDHTTSQRTRPSTTRADSHRSSPTATQSPAPARQPVPHSTPSSLGPDAAADPRATPTTAPQSRATTSSSGANTAGNTGGGTGGSGGGKSTGSGSGGTAPQQSSTSSGSGGTDPGTPQTSPTPTATSQQQVCVLVLCLG